MSRPLRIEYPDAWYQVINRARREKILYVDTDDYRRFLDLLQDTADMFNILKKHSSVSSVIERTQNRLGMDRQFSFIFLKYTMTLNCLVTSGVAVVDEFCLVQ